MKKSLLIYNVTLVDSKIDSLGAVLVCDGIIKNVLLGNFADEKKAVIAANAILSAEEADYQIETYDGKALTLMPAFIDLHAHFRYPGFEQKEDLISGITASSAGGYSTLVLMPNTKPVVSSVQTALSNNRIVEETKKGRVFQTVSITRDFGGTDTSHLDSLNSRDVPVITEDGNDVGSSAVMLEAMKKASEKGIIVSCHCEDKDLREIAKVHRNRALALMKKFEIPAWGADVEKIVPAEINFEIDENLTKANNLLALAEDAATARNIEIAELADCHVHIAHCSTKKSMDYVRAAKERLKGMNGKLDMGENNKFNVTVEVTPHHLGLVGTEAPLIRALVNPPLRSQSDRKALWDALVDGTADVISTDHAPHTAEDKAAGSPGFTGIELSYSVCYNTLVKGGILSHNRLSQLMSENPAKILKLNEGTLEVGKEANFALVDENEVWTVDSSKFFSKGKATPLEGKRLTGRIKATFFKGEISF